LRYRYGEAKAKGSFIGTKNVHIIKLLPVAVLCCEHG